MKSRPVPLNRPARGGGLVAGNPAITSLESAVGNCYPGLELDLRNLDRRFFPGLIIEFVWSAFSPDPAAAGARVIAVDPNDGDIPDDAALKGQLMELQSAIQDRKLFLQTIEQGGHRVELWDKKSAPFDGSVVWRIVRSLQPAPLRITITERIGGKAVIFGTLQGQRRTLTETGGIPEVFEPGELGQSLCSPWQHDFRDCTCNYWASNHPDIVLGAFPAEDAGAEDPTGGDEQADRRTIWERWNLSRPAAPQNTMAACRPFEIDHYEINRRWQELPIVIEGHELPAIYTPGPVAVAAPFPNEGALIGKLHELAGMELALSLEYLYARYSIRTTGFSSEEEQDHAAFLSHELLVIAVSEMMHLRWVNQLLWEIWQSHPASVQEFRPAISLAELLPRFDPSDGRRIKNGQNVRGDLRNEILHVGKRRPVLRRLDEAIGDFLAAEVPSGTIEGQYAQVFATLQHGYPVGMAELASRIIADGVSHFTRFREVRSVLRHYASREAVEESRRTGMLRVTTLIWDLAIPKDATSEIDEIEHQFSEIINNLKVAYRSGNVEDREKLIPARAAMEKMDDLAILLARTRQGDEPGVGVPFLDIAKTVIGGSDSAKS